MKGKEAKKKRDVEEHFLSPFKNVTISLKSFNKMT